MKKVFYASLLIITLFVNYGCLGDIMNFPATLIDEVTKSPEQRKAEQEKKEAELAKQQEQKLKHQQEEEKRIAAKKFEEDQAKQDIAMAPAIKEKYKKNAGIYDYKLGMTKDEVRAIARFMKDKTKSDIIRDIQNSHKNSTYVSDPPSDRDIFIAIRPNIMFDVPTDLYTCLKFKVNPDRLSKEDKEDFANKTEIFLNTSAFQWVFVYFSDDKVIGVARYVPRTRSEATRKVILNKYNGFTVKYTYPLNNVRRFLFQGETNSSIIQMNVYHIPMSQDDSLFYFDKNAFNNILVKSYHDKIKRDKSSSQSIIE